MYRPFFSCCAFALFVCLLAHAAVPLVAAIHDYEATDGTRRSLRLNVPAIAGPIRGILIWGNGADGDARAMAVDAELVAFAHSLDFALIATGQWGNFSDTGRAELRLFNDGLARLAALSGRPELVDAPWLPIGHSNGGQMSYGLNALSPDKVIAIVVSKGCCYNDPRPPAASLRTPGLLIAGEADTGLRRANIRDLYTGNRPRGALWAWVEEQGMDHDEGASAELIRPFIEECVRLRLPADANPRLGPVVLRALDEASGWLVESDSYKAGFAQIAAYASYNGDRTTAGWLPSQRLAAVFRAFASYRKTTNTPGANGADSNHIAARGTEIVYRISRPVPAWQSIEVFEGASLVGQFTPSESDLALRTTATGSGYLVFHAVTNFADGSRRTAMPARVFVPPVPAGAPATGTGTTNLDTPSRVAPLTLQLLGATPAALQWEPASGATSYRVEYALTAAGPWTTLAEVRETRCRASALLAGLRYFFRVGARFADGELVLGDPAVVDVPIVRGSTSRLLNLSARGNAGPGAGALIVGFSHLGSLRVLVRAIGPGLAAFGLVSPLANPELRVLRADGSVLAANDDWDENSTIISELEMAMRTAGAFPLLRYSRDAAALVELKATPNSHALLVTGGVPGTALAEIYEAALDRDARLINLSVRGQLSLPTSTLIAGFEIAGADPLTVLLRAAGPVLAAFGVGEPLADPILALHQGSRDLLRNDDWQESSNEGDIRRAEERTGAFRFPTDSRDSALLVTLAPGSYTFVVSGRDLLTGNTLAEIYVVP